MKMRAEARRNHSRIVLATFEGSIQDLPDFIDQHTAASVSITIEPLPRVSDERFINGMRQLKTVVGQLYNLYDRDPSLNDRFDIQDLIVEDLGEWHSRFLAWMEKHNG